MVLVVVASMLVFVASEDEEAVSTEAVLALRSRLFCLLLAQHGLFHTEIWLFLPEIWLFLPEIWLFMPEIWLFLLEI